MNRFAVALAFVCVGQALSHADSADITGKIDAIAADVLQKAETPGLSIAVSRGGEVIHAKAYGFADLEHNVKASEETVYQIGSITKTFTAVAIMQLVERGKVELDVPVQTYLPEYPKHETPVTVNQLLTHTSGIPNYTEINDDWRAHRTQEEMLDVFQHEPLNFPPGQGFAYTNSGYYLLGLIIEAVSGTTYAEYLNEHIFANSDFSSAAYIEPERIVTHRARGYLSKDKAFANAGVISMTVPYAAGALEATAVDLLKWQHLLHSNALLRADTIESMVNPKPLGDGSFVSYGYGFMIGDLEGHRKIAHEGGIDGFVSQFAWYPDDDLAVVVLCNSESTSAPPIERRITRAVLGIADPEIVDLPLDPGAAKGYVGTYRSGSTGVHISERKGVLKLKVDVFLPWPISLKHQGGGHFVLAVDPDIRVQFQESPGTPRVRLSFGDVIVEALRNDDGS